MPTFNFDEIRTLTNEQFASEIANLIRLTSTEIERLFPRKQDKERLLELMTIVRSAASRNSKAAQIRSNIGALGESIVKVLEILA